MASVTGYDRTTGGVSVKRTPEELKRLRESKSKRLLEQRVTILEGKCQSYERRISALESLLKIV